MSNRSMSLSSETTDRPEASLGESGASSVKIGEREAGDVIHEGQIAFVAVVPHQLSGSC